MMLGEIKSLDAAVGNARLIREVTRFTDAVKADDNTRMNNAISILPNVISDDLVKLSNIRLSALSEKVDVRKIDDPELKRQEMFIQKVVDAIPKGDPRRQLIRQQLLKQFKKRNEENSPDVLSAREEHARHSHLPMPNQSNVAGFELRNEAFNVRDGGIRLENGEIVFTPNQGVNEVLITGATLSILAQTDAEKRIRIEGNKVTGLSIVNTARSDILDIHVRAAENCCDFLTSRGQFRVMFSSEMTVLRIHSSVQQDGWNIRKKEPQMLQKEIGMVFDFLNDHRRKKLAPNYQSDILSFSGGQ